jgi:hypothetical protein
MKKKTNKREKRIYQKKRLLTQDELWKLIIPLLWQDFVHHFLPEMVDEIDFSQKPDFLDKDLKRLMILAKSKNRAVDILMRIYLKNGKSKTFLLHVEVQAYFEDDFCKRVFQYYYRITDLLQESIETLVIMIDEDPDYRPTEYVEKFGKTSIHFIFGMFKLLDNPPPYQIDNIFSIVLEVAWHALKQNKLKNDADLETLKFGLLKRLIDKGIEPERIHAIMEFINIYLPFENPENDLIFEEKFDNLINKDCIMEPMTIREYLTKKVEIATERRVKREYKNIIKAEQEKMIAKQQKSVLNLHAKGFSAEDIADVLSIPLAFVHETLEK